MFIILVVWKKAEISAFEKRNCRCWKGNAFWVPWGIDETSTLPFDGSNQIITSCLYHASSMHFLNNKNHQCHWQQYIMNHHTPVTWTNGSRKRLIQLTQKHPRKHAVYKTSNHSHSTSIPPKHHLHGCLAHLFSAVRVPRSNSRGWQPFVF